MTGQPGSNPPRGNSMCIGWLAISTWTGRNGKRTVSTPWPPAVHLRQISICLWTSQPGNQLSTGPLGSHWPRGPYHIHNPEAEHSPPRSCATQGFHDSQAHREAAHGKEPPARNHQVNSGRAQERQRRWRHWCCQESRKPGVQPRPEAPWE